LKADQSAAERSLAEATKKASAAAKLHEEIAERVKNATAARAAVATARTELAALERERAGADAATEAAATLEPKLQGLSETVAELAALESERDLLMDAKRERDLQRERRASLEAELARVRGARVQKTAAITKAADRRNDLVEQARRVEQTPDALCDRCEQTLPDQARAKAVASLLADADKANREANDLEKDDAALAESELQLGRQLEQFGEATVDEAGEARYAHVHARCIELAGAREQLATATERLSGLQAAATLREGFAGELAETERAVRQHTAELAWAAEPEPGSLEKSRAAVQEADAVVGATRVQGEQAVLRLAQAEARLELIEQAARDHATATAERDRLRGELDELAVLERAFGRDGVPTWVLETSAIPALEVEADRLLGEFGTDYHVELRTERELKSGGAAETLDVAVLTDRGARPYETFSGGERTRINLALRIALARLLANRRGAESRLLAIDEPDGLDEKGMAALVDVLRDLDVLGEFDRVLLVSHIPALRDAFDATLNVVKTDGRSEVTVN
jgi:exonuclease SbcC